RAGCRMELPHQPRARAVLYRPRSRDPDPRRGAEGRDHRAGRPAHRGRPPEPALRDHLQGGTAQPLPGPLRAPPAPPPRAPPHPGGAGAAGAGRGMKVATWNVNSIRSRLERVTAWLAREGPDVLCLHETKCADAEFPRAAFEELGYRVELHGQRTYNGV